jgi:FkbM family methyltransferase
MCAIDKASLYRKARIFYRRAIGTEPTISVTHKTRLKYHGNKGYGGWAIPCDILRADSVVVDIGLGEDISFSESLIAEYGCCVHGFDPTPKSITYVRKKSPRNFQLHEMGVASSNRIATFFLPNNPAHASGSIVKSTHVGNNQIDVKLIDIDNVLKVIDQDRIDLLKIDIEGAEYELLDSASFRNNATRIRVLCIEFHHRWDEFGVKATLEATSTLRYLGFECVWQARETNEEFTYMNTRSTA